MISDHAEYWVNDDNRVWLTLGCCVKWYEKGFCSYSEYWVLGENRVLANIG